MNIEMTTLDWQVGDFTEINWVMHPDAWVLGRLDAPEYDPYGDLQILTRLEFGKLDRKLLNDWVSNRNITMAGLSGNYPVDRNVLLKPAFPVTDSGGRYRDLIGPNIPVRHVAAWVPEPSFDQFKWNTIDPEEFKGEGYPIPHMPNTRLVALLKDGRIVATVGEYDMGNTWKFIHSSVLFDVYGVESFTLFEPREVEAIAVIALPDILQKRQPKLTYF